ncbi:MAG: hypothetical protein DRJ38_02085 [Thermoprotei archaeon]|nr:MAG: hypothetical protein DRJ38_02085 [Thermoprotei archaeon]
MRVLLTTIPGLEDIVVKEIEEKIESLRNINYKKLSGRIYISIGKDDKSLLQKLHELRCIERVILILGEGESSKENIDIYLDSELVSKFLGPRMTFMVRSLRIGEHTFTSTDIAAILGKNIQEAIYEKWRFYPEVSLSDPDIIFYIEIVEDVHRWGIDLTGLNALHRRKYRVYVHPSSLNPIIAYCMCRIARINEKKRILDPMCGSGTILIEGKYLNPHVKAWGLDINPQHIAGARLNAEEAGVEIKFETADIADIDELFPPSFFDAIITNPPFGIREKSIYTLSRLYSLLVEKSKKLLRKEGILCVLTPRKKLLLNILAKHNFFIEKTFTLRHGGITSFIITAVKSS